MKPEGAPRSAPSPWRADAGFCAFAWKHWPADVALAAHGGYKAQSAVQRLRWRWECWAALGFAPASAGTQGTQSAPTAGTGDL